MKPSAAFGRRVRHLREALTLTQLELATRARMQRTDVVKIERGQRDPTVSTITKLARALHVPPAQLFEEAPRASRRPRRTRKT
jgi:transcriptional regulator with XRE-family HTH domain